MKGSSSVATWSGHAMPLCQVALSTTHLLRTHHWYRRALGLAGAGRVRHLDNQRLAPIVDLPESALDVSCLVDRQAWFQLELIESRRPRMRRMPDDWRRSDIGYSGIGLHVSDFDEAIDRVMRTSGRLLGAPIGERGSRRVCLRDPEGILLELMEEDVRSRRIRPRVHDSIPTVVRSITLSVPDLRRARRFWMDAVGFEAADDVVLHGPEHEALWGMDGASCESLLLWGGDVLIELVQYTNPPGRWRPAGYLLSDQGILNVALGSTEKDQFEAQCERIMSHGYRSHTEPWTLRDVATVVYFADDQGFSLELLHVERDSLEEMGFVPNPSDAAMEGETLGARG